VRRAAHRRELNVVTVLEHGAQRGETATLSAVNEHRVHFSDPAVARQEVPECAQAGETANMPNREPLG
jgi:hypothetical protein